MTPEDIVDRVRVIVKDPDGAGEIWAEADYYVALNDGLREIYNNAPQSRVQSDGTLVAFAEASTGSPSASLWLDDFYTTMLVDYVVYRFFISDAHDSKDRTRGNEFYAKFLRNFSPTVRG